MVVLDPSQRVLEDCPRARQHVHEDEGENSDGEHGQRHARPAPQQLQPSCRQPKEDGEAGERPEGDGVSEGHAGAYEVLGDPNSGPW